MGTWLGKTQGGSCGNTHRSCRAQLDGLREGYFHLLLVPLHMAISFKSQRRHWLMHWAVCRSPNRTERWTGSPRLEEDHGAKIMKPDFLCHLLGGGHHRQSKWDIFKRQSTTVRMTVLPVKKSIDYWECRISRVLYGSPGSFQETFAKGMLGRDTELL